ncbi:polyprenyl synthetase family protein [Hirschia baltica]|uniref:Polyprenyl synthetase n=1 Tax=Hirschia baltica (strain ATCC 49814 / DSM 5838 / IFAM 1418) TaxID=582402 RepID=C6XI53_HIRBI|nr:farnesyl diphosphate synthase [Hirschia baltica]ACT58879.1 Polyprenyl synthetase [Hirschia baltica ATCC 49814]
MTEQLDAIASFEQSLAECADKVTVVLDKFIPSAIGPEAQLMRAMRHGALAGGKRLRPFITIEVGRLFDAPEKSLLRAASALECVHAYSLVHDDLPCMDDDDLRRGLPTVHKAFDEATAVLAGDALQALAFEILANTETHGDAGVRCKLIEVLALSSGARGMVGGQMIDMAPSFDDKDALNILARMQRMKTGALISCAAEFGAIIGGANEHEHQALAGFTTDLGLAYQIKDDLLDVQGDEAVLGKAVSKDKDAGKQNFVSLLGEESAISRIEMLADQAKQHLSVFGGRATTLTQTVDFVLDRRH